MELSQWRIQQCFSKQDIPDPNCSRFQSSTHMLQTYVFAILRSDPEQDRHLQDQSEGESSLNLMSYLLNRQIWQFGGHSCRSILLQPPHFCSHQTHIVIEPSSSTYLFASCLIYFVIWAYQRPWHIAVMDFWSPQ